MNPSFVAGLVIILISYGLHDHYSKKEEYDTTTKNIILLSGGLGVIVTIAGSLKAFQASKEPLSSFTLDRPTSLQDAFQKMHG